MVVVKARGRAIYFPARQINKRKKSCFLMRKKKCKCKFAFKHFSRFSTTTKS